MRVAYLDTFAGIAGDMVLGAFVSAGVRIDQLTKEIAKLDLGQVELRSEDVSKNGISAKKIEVRVAGEVERVVDLGSNVYEHSHGYDKPHRHRASHRGDKHGRSYLEIRHLIENSSLSDFVKTKSLAIFLKLAEAESKIHEAAIEKVHFHEVGAVDSIVDIVGTALCLECARIDSVFTSPILLGSGGYVEAQHGVLPVASPAALEILKGYPIVFNDIPHELTTPTGAAIVAALSKGILGNQPIEVEKIGYGSGTKDLGRLPNLLRVMIGKVGSAREEDHNVLMETNMDDINPQLIPFVIERVLALGATDAFVTPLIMKKGRPGFMLSVLTSETLLDKISTEVFSQTTTLGLRIQSIRRIKLHRELKTVGTSFGPVQVKESNIDGKRRVFAEFEECKRISESEHIPLTEVMQRLNAELNREL
jgi:uncharacterized protein (TIGR00299 family) protein